MLIQVYRLNLLSVAAMLVLGAIAHADCVDPYNPAIERTELSTNHNSYAEESEICITEAAKFCDHCVAGYKHKCEGGWWQPQTHLSCSVQVDKEEPITAQPDKSKEALGGTIMKGPDGKEFFMSEGCEDEQMWDSFEAQEDRCYPYPRSTEPLSRSDWCARTSRELQCHRSLLAIGASCDILADGEREKISIISEDYNERCRD